MTAKAGSTVVHLNFTEIKQDCDYSFHNAGLEPVLIAHCEDNQIELSAGESAGTIWPSESINKDIPLLQIGKKACLNLLQLYRKCMLNMHASPNSNMQESIVKFNAVVETIECMTCVTVLSQHAKWHSKFNAVVETNACVTCIPVLPQHAEKHC